VVSENGIPLGIVNTIQNNNTKTLTAAVSFAKLYTALGLKSRSSNFTSQPRRPQAVNDSSAVKKNTVLKKSITRAVDVLTAIKRIQISYNENNGSVLPGYLPSVGFAGSMRPTLGYTLGSQADIRYEAARQGWLTAFPNFNQSFTQLRSNRFKSTAQVVPFEGLIIDINAERDFAENVMENFSIQNQEYFPRNSNRYGNFGMSTVLVQTAFKNGRGITHENFENFRNNRLILAQRLAENSSIDTTEKDAEGYPTGFGKNQQAVILHSFLAAYSGVDAAAVSLDPFRQTPLPNWNLKFTGLTKLKPIADLFSRFSLNHAYRASYTLTNFQTNFDYNPQLPNALDKAGNQIPEILYSNVNLVEQFNPLARIDMEFTNSLRVLAEIRKERAISLSLDNNLITESLGDEYVVGLGYRIQEVRFRTSIGGRRVILNGDLNIKADVSYRDNVTVLRNLEYDNNQVTAGQRLMSIKIAADYALTRNLTALFFYDHNFSEFAISTAFPQTSVRSGFTIRYNFGN
jgi:cell surface protein SprA